MRYSTYNAIPQYPKSKKHPYENLAKIGLFGFFYFSSKTMKLKNAENLISKSSVS